MDGSSLHRNWRTGAFLATCLSLWLGFSAACTTGRAENQTQSKMVFTPVCREVGAEGVTIGSLLDGPPRKTPSRVQTLAWFRGSADCGTCPPDALCQPCFSMVRFSDRADSPEREWFWLIQDMSPKAIFKEGCAYRLTLALDGDYRKHLLVRDNNPLFYENLFAVRIVGVD